MFDKKAYMKEYMKQWHKDNPEYDRQWKKGNKEHIKEYSKEYKKKYNKECKEYSKKYYQEHKDYLREYTREWRNKNGEYMELWNKQKRIKLLNIVSNNNLRCVRCGCNDVRLLEINHKNGGGNKELQGGKTKTKFYEEIIKGKRETNDLELLCRICNSLHYLESKFGELPYKVLYNKIIKEDKNES